MVGKAVLTRLILKDQLLCEGALEETRKCRAVPEGMNDDDNDDDDSGTDEPSPTPTAGSENVESNQLCKSNGIHSSSFALRENSVAF